MRDIMIYIGIWNVIMFFLYGLDKFFAKHRMWRVPEIFMLACAFLFGGVGSFLGMKVFHHKTRKMEFAVLLPLSIFANILFIAVLNYLS